MNKTNTRERILTLLSKSKEPRTAKSISFELKKGRADIRKILSNLYKEGKINKVSYGVYSSVNITVNVKTESVNVEENELIRRAINEDHRKHYAKHKETRRAYFNKYYADNREAIRAYHRKYYAEHIEKMRAFNRKYYKLYPERRKEYERRYWLKRAKAGLNV